MDCKSQTRVYRSLLYHGVDNHIFEIICECNKSNLDLLEEYYVNLYNSFNTKHGMNLKSGGSANGNHSDETKQKISKANKGKKRSQEHCRQNSERQKGTNGCNYGKTFTIETRLKMSKSSVGRIKSKDEIMKLSKAHSKPIDMYSMEGVFIRRYESTLKAAEIHNVKPINITACLNGRSKSSNGFIWKKVKI